MAFGTSLISEAHVDLLHREAKFRSLQSEQSLL